MSSHASAIGIGAQVFVRDASDAERSPWPAEPSGIVFRSGGSALAGVWGAAGGGQWWWVEFDEPQLRADGEGPFSTAQVLDKFLELAPPVSDADNDDS